MTNHKTKFYLVIIILLIWSCSSQTNNTVHYNHDVKQNIVDKAKNLSAVLTDSVFYSFNNIGNDTFKLLWGNKEMKNVSRINFTTFDIKSLSVFAHNKNYIFLSKPCGISCSYFLILPLTSNLVEREYLYVKALDLELELIAYVSEHHIPVLSLMIENFNSGKGFEMSESDVCTAIDKTECIKKCEFLAGKLRYSWDSKSGFKTKTIDINEKDFVHIAR